jgi:NADPH:quinone reductase-like Zn-dependent oxidoreductase
LKAVRIPAPGGGERLLYEDVDDPELRLLSDVIVKLRAATVNRSDLTNSVPSNCVRMSFPHIPGADGAGVVISAGAQVRNIKPGDAVCIYPLMACGNCQFCAKQQEFRCGERRLLGGREQGTYAEYVRLPAINCFPIPDGLSFEEAAAVSLAYPTVWRMLFTQADLKPGESVLIMGAGGIGSAALQLATAVGARVFVTSRSEQKLAAAAERGAHHGIHCPPQDLAQEVRRLTGRRGVDVVVNSIGGDTWSAGLAALARGGRLVTCGTVAGSNPKTELRRVFWNHLTISAASFPTRQEFCSVLEFFNHPCRRPVIDRVFPLREAGRAHQRLQQSAPFGKIVLRTDV